MKISEGVLITMIEDFKNGVNLTQKYGNDLETIEIAYELQSGVYTEVAERQVEIQEKFFFEVADHFNLLPDLSEQLSLLEMGVGEGNSLLGISKKLDFYGKYFGVDLSYSRLSWCKENFRKKNIPIILAVSHASHLPFFDKSIDIVLTVHSLEPNGNNEQLLLNELARISKKYLILIEPDYGKADSKQKQRMESMSYIGDLRRFLDYLPFDLIVDEPIKDNLHLVDNIPINSASILILRRRESITEIGNSSFCTPMGHSELNNVRHGMISDAGLYFPSLDGIPFLRPLDALYCLAPKFDVQTT